ncbi:MAG: DUF3318 domain-containing protein [Geminocystis sp.]|nr:DUF3318 domain-containing protein [Geminocystis sp.]HIK36889.1 DUF3318 domain-containing protein [Geminocystis sp. M7585_C2015_104]MCS7148533.1 DUF3318 domain-containing protein [Geminocystis sp.]MCX8079489.1 DUF3318 domain-containing protein [Geminocystis sp.]MDW8114894.1 DUF3318 domain-containing protein [Geminocystis sp.]
MTYTASSARAEMNELRRLKTLLPPELQSWVMVEASTEINPPLIRTEEIGRDEVEIQIDLAKWENLAIDQRNLLFWHEVARIQNDTIPREGWEMAALAIGLGGAVGELWVQDGLLLLLALALCGISGYRLWQKNNSEKVLKDAIEADEKAIQIATRFGYSLKTAYQSLGSALKTLIEQTPNRRQRKIYEERLQALRRSAARIKQQQQQKETQTTANQPLSPPPTSEGPRSSARMKNI